ncbi:hypothetical protein Celaphus_00015511 [Cervus elaphus hippelaphus]|uniref:Uncharacterized protein n=1 Tax=Cervus elaphus hippelaphus TaxID=46360 RepID=A0A212CS31_CEREH|nr:hypothetical protein Celaphus_00015511 [Cervus elaphus hippelaphus]
MKRSSWSTLTVSQAKEAYRKSSLHLDKPPGPPELKPPLRPCHYLQLQNHAGEHWLLFFILLDFGAVHVV